MIARPRLTASPALTALLAWTALLAQAGCFRSARSYVGLSSHAEHCQEAIRRCEAAPSAWCQTAGDCHEHPPVGARKLGRALSYYQHGCEGGDGHSCVATAALRLLEGGPRDVEDAKACFERACDLYADFCEIGARALEGRWVAIPPDPVRAAALRDAGRVHAAGPARPPPRDCPRPPVRAISR